MKAIMYHYVRPPNPELPYFRYLHLHDFRRQLDWFAKQFRFATREEFLASFAGAPVPKDAVVLTFDDGLLDHLDFVVPELVARGLWGIFYVPCGPYLEGRLLDVHRIHLLLGRFGGPKMVSVFKSYVTDEMLTHEHVSEYRSLTYPGQASAEHSTLFKRMMNYFISYEWRSRVLDCMMQDLFDDEHQELERFYIPREKLSRFPEAGMMLGSHSVSHPVMARLGREGQKKEIDDSFRFLEAAAGELAPRTFCFPYGGPYTYTAETESLLTEAGTLFSFDVSPRDVEEKDILRRPQALPRFDCNLFPHGTASGPAS